MSTFVIVAIAAILLISIPAGMMSRRIHKRTEDHDPEARQAALDFQRDVEHPGAVTLQVAVFKLVARPLGHHAQGVGEAAADGSSAHLRGERAA